MSAAVAHSLCGPELRLTTARPDNSDHRIQWRATSLTEHHSSTGDFWHGHEDYDIGNEPSPYLMTHGRVFLHRHLPTNPTLADFGCWGGRHLKLLYGLTGSDGKVVGIDGPWAWARLADAESIAGHLEPSRVTLVRQRLDRLNALSSFGPVCFRV